MANIILTNLSVINKSNSGDVIHYKTYDERIFVDGIRTNDAPIKCLMKEIMLSGANVDRILVVTTAEAEETTYKDFVDMVIAYAAELGVNAPELESIHTSDDEMPQTVKEITEKISVEDKLYIDTTGGFRNASYLLMAVVRILEYSNIKVVRAVYSNLQTKEIKDVTEIYDMFDLINAVNTFTSSGNSREMEDYFSGCTNETVKKTIAVMNEFSDEITLCRTTKLDSVLEQLNDCLAELKEVQPDSKDIVLFKCLSETIRKKFNIKNEKIEYPDIVKWCLDNRMLQQAVTIYVEKMPKYFYNRGYFSVASEKKLEELKAHNEKTFSEFYYELFYTHLMCAASLPWSVYNFSNIIKSAVTYDFENKFIRPTDEVIILRALIECEDISTFYSRICKKAVRKYNLEAMREELKRFFQIKRALYVDNKLRNEADREKSLSKYPDVEEIINRTTIPNDSKKFVKALSNNEQLIQAICGKKSKYSDKHLEFIDGIADKNVSTDFVVTDKIAPKELQQIFGDIYYLKTFVRNKLNHASEERNNDELIAYFAEHGYKTDGDLSVKYINHVLGRALERLTI